MFWRIVFWVAVVEVVVCVLPIELTGVTAMIRFLFFEASQMTVLLLNLEI
jgi:hypothetical protein